MRTGVFTVRRGDEEHRVTVSPAGEVRVDDSAPLTLHESAELRGKLAAWEDDWNAPGMEAYDRP